MNTPKSIILAVDLSANSAFAAQWASQWAQLSGAQVILAHVIEISVPNWLRGAYDVLEDAQKYAQVKEKVHQWYTLHTQRQAQHVIVAVGHPHEQLSRLAREHEASMLVLARSSKSRLEKFLAGSTAQMLALAPPCVVTIVHADHTQLSAQARVAVATDLTEASKTALLAGVTLAQTLGSDRLDVVHAATFGPSSSFDDLALLTSADPSKLRAQMRDQLERQTEAAQEAVGQGVTVQSHLIDDEPVPGIKSMVDQEHVEVLIVGNASEYNVVTNVFGRVSVKLTREVDSTVMVVPPSSDVAHALGVAPGDADPEPPAQGEPQP